MAYTTDLTPEEYQIIEPLLISNRAKTRPPKWSKHEILNGIFYQLVNGCRWVDLPKDLPPSGTVFYWFNRWKQDGTWQSISQKIFIQSRIEQGKKRNSITLD